MQGVTVFYSLGEAIRHGYQVYDRTPSGYSVRIRIAQGWAFALVEVKC